MDEPIDTAMGVPDADEDLLNNCGPISIPPPPVPVQAADSTGPRLMISQIVTENFKSYGGMRVMGPFHKNFTCIIGQYCDWDVVVVVNDHDDANCVRSNIA